MLDVLYCDHVLLVGVEDFPLQVAFDRQLFVGLEFEERGFLDISGGDLFPNEGGASFFVHE